jgi:predicted AlkP superfamily pyrophosphatase or phosphodiesterase
LRADAIPTFGLDNWRRLAAGGAASLSGRTVEPSVTAAALSSLLTGVEPRRHGLTSDRFHLPRPQGALKPLPRYLAEAGLQTSAFIRELPLGYRSLGRGICRRLGVDLASFAGSSATGILDAARPALRTQRRGLVFLHWPDCDRAGHEHGWMSPPYATAARRLDSLLGELAREAETGNDLGTLLIALADHGGGGADSHDHDSGHPLDTPIPLLLAGDAVAGGELFDPTLLDVAPTIAWALGLPQPDSWQGRPLSEAFTPALALAQA